MRVSPRKLLIATFVALAGLAAVEFGARVIYAGLDFPHATEDPRNPFYRRAWPEFTTPVPPREGERTVIVMSNSQGFFRESADGSKSYVPLLGDLLREAEPERPTRVLNWSIDGGNSPEWIVLSARAAETEPDLIVVVSWIANYTSRRLRRPLSYMISDVNQMAYEPEVRRYLSDRFLDAFDVQDPLGWLSVNSGLVRLRDRFVEPRHDRWSFVSVPPPPDIDLSKVPMTVRPWVDRSTLLLEELAGTLDRAVPDSRVLFVSMPVCGNALKPADWPRMRGFLPRCREILADRPDIEMLEAIDVVDADLFYTPVHLNPEGHEVFARWLSPRILERLPR